MKVGILTSDLAASHGWASYCLNLVRALDAAGVELTVIAARNSPDVPSIRVYKLLPTVSPRESGFLPKLALALPSVRNALRDCDIIHAAVEPYAPLTAALAGTRPLFVTGHGSYVRVDKAWGTPARPLYTWAFRRSRMICVSHYTARIAESVMPGLRTTVINNGVDAARYAHLPVLDEPKPDGPILLSVGAVKARKGTRELIRALSVVREHFPNVICILAGNLTLEPDYVAAVRADIDRLGLQNAVRLLGFVPDAMLMGWYSAANLFVLPSMNAGWKFEGYGIALIEASAAGLPVIGTTDCGAEDAVDDAVTGLLVPQQGIDAALPEAIIRLLSDPALAAEMGAAGREKAARQSWDSVAAQVMAAYRAEGREPRTE